jgi:hypothetical protein
VFRIYDILVWIRIRILLFSSLTFKMPAKNKFFNIISSAFYFLKLHLHYFSKIKSQKESENSRIQGFSYYFCMIIQGSGSGSGSIPLTSISGSGFGRAKNMWIRIRNTGSGKLNFTSYIIWFISVQSILTEHQLKSLLPIFLWSKIENYSQTVIES